MNVINEYHQIAAVSIARVFLGFLFFTQGYDIVFNITLARATKFYQDNFKQKNILRLMILFASWFTAYSELVCGIFLVLGLFNCIVLYVLGLNLLITSLRFGMTTALWDTRNVFPRLILLVFLLLVPQELHVWTLDYLLF